MKSFVKSLVKLLILTTRSTKDLDLSIELGRPMCIWPYFYVYSNQGHGPESFTVSEGMYDWADVPQLARLTGPESADSL